MYQGYRQSGYATAAISVRDGRYDIAIDGPSSQAVRTIPTFRMLRQLAVRQDFGELILKPSLRRSGITFVQYFDVALNNMRSVAFCKDVQSPTAISLIPDTYFFFHEGYSHLRERVTSKVMPDWLEREERVFWRGTPTVNWDLEQTNAIADIGEVPRIKMCMQLKTMSCADVAIQGTWGNLFPQERVTKFLSENGILGQFIPMAHHCRYRYLIDIDGVGSAWSFFEKLLLGSTLIKVGSRYSQWFYGELKPWEHFVPAEANLRDIESKVVWCLEHPSQARDIAAAGQEVALSWPFERACAFTVKQIASCLIPLKR